MADKRAFAKFDVGYLDNPKMMDVLDSSLHAICMHVASVLYCSQHLTDGIVSPKAMQRKVGGSDADTKILIDAGLWHDQGHDCESCRKACPDVPDSRVYVHDFLEHNRDAAQAKRVSKKRSDAAKARWAAEIPPEKPAESIDANCIQDALQKDPVCNAERERERENLKDLSIDQSKDVVKKPRPNTDEEFAQWYATYPRKEAKAAALKAFIKVRKTVTLEELIAGVQRYVPSIAGKERQLIALPATWLNAGRWEDDYGPITNTGNQAPVPNQYRMFN